MFYLLSIKVLTVIFIFGTVVIIHELGHFMMAKLFKIRVEAFAVGFGPRLFGFRKAETDYRVCAIPLGGYVKMAGENPHEELTGGIEEFLSRPKWQRFLVAIMGPVMNILLAVFLLTGIYYYKYEEPAWLTEPVVVGVVNYDSPGEKAGILAGDRIIAVSGKKDIKWEQFLLEIGTSAGRPLDLEIIRDGQTIHKEVTPESHGRQHEGEIGVFPVTPFLASLVAKNVMKGKPAAEAGILPGDQIIKVDNVDLIKEGKDLPDVLKRTTSDVVLLTVLRNGQEITLPVKPYKEGGRRLIGIERGQTQTMVIEKLSLGQAFQASIRRNIQFAGMIFDILQKLIRREVSWRMIEGPIGIAKQSSMAANSGFSYVLLLMVAISLNLGIMNLLPIPVLDGGVIAIILLETLIRRDLSLAIRERITQVGVVMLIALAVIVTYNDIIKSLPVSIEKYFP